MYKFLLPITIAIFSNEAFAEVAAQPAQPSAFASIFPLIVFLALMYFIALRPQMKKVKKHQQLVSEMKKGDKVITAGGILAKVTKLDADGVDAVEVEIASGVKVNVVKSTITGFPSAETSGANDNAAKAKAKAKAKGGKKKAA